MDALRKKLNILLVITIGVWWAVAYFEHPVGAAANPPPQPVTVTNTPLPVAVSGSTAVTGSVAITGTPSVNVANMPTVSLAQGTGVAITNVPTVNDGTNPTADPFQVDVSYFAGATGDPLVGSDTFTVATGKTLVIDSLSGRAYAPGATDVEYELTLTAGGNTVTHWLGGHLAPAPALLTGYFVLPLTRTLLVADGGSTATLRVVRDTAPPAGTGWFNDLVVAGHYVPTP